MSFDRTAIEQTLDAARTKLLSARVPAGHWEGQLSSSALSTATAITAMELFRQAGGDRRTASSPPLTQLISAAFDWLVDHQNDDGGWGDTVDSPSNISTTTLCWAALGLIEQSSDRYADTERRATQYLEQLMGELTPSHISRSITSAYGKDRTFAAPILTMCALTGRLGRGRDAWRSIPALPFELGALPHTWFRRLGLSVVSYALPALIAIGQVRHVHRPTRNPITRLFRNLARKKTLAILRNIQPSSGGYLEAAPLTSFVVMSLTAMGLARHPVVESGIGFLVDTVRSDGSWPIDTNLATWCTTLAVGAITSGSTSSEHLDTDSANAIREWLLDQQYKVEHPYTHAAPGGWAWTDLPGGVPDADDTPGALLALWNLRGSDASDDSTDDRTLRSATLGVRWLLDVQNLDGGIPTFCRGWGKLPFDQSSPDLTAHSIRAWATWRRVLPRDIQSRIDVATEKAVRFLLKTQQIDGSWRPLWFGNQAKPNTHNPLYGTTRVLRAARVTPIKNETMTAWSAARVEALSWVLSAQRSDGGWGGAADLPASIEETALAVEALADVLHHDRIGVLPPGPQAETMGHEKPAGGIEVDQHTRAATVASVQRGCDWLVKHTHGGTQFKPAPIGLYFAKLWYSERLYPIIFTVSALQRVCDLPVDMLDASPGSASTVSGRGCTV